MSTRFLNNININDSYTLPPADGTADQVISTDGAGQLSFIDQTTLSAESAEVVKVPVKNLQGSALTKGDPVYISGSVGTSGRLEVKLADAGDTTKMPALGLLEQDLAINGEGYVVITGKLRNLITSPIDSTTTSGGEVIYVKSGGTTGSALTTVKPTGINFIQNVGKVGRASTSNDGTLVVSSILRSNDVPTPLYIDHNNQRVGIDEKTPAEKLVVSEIRTGSTATDLYTTVVKSVQSSGASPNPGTGGLKVQYYDGTNNHAFGLVAGTTSSDFLTTGPMHFYTNSDLDTVSATGYAMQLNNNGQLIIAGTIPLTGGAKLSVSGDAAISSNLGVGVTGSIGEKIDVYGTSAVIRLRNTSMTSGTGSGVVFGGIMNAETASLTVNTSTDLNYIVGTRSSGTTQFTIKSGGSVGINEYIYHLGDDDTKFGFVANDNFAITTSGAERVRVTSGGSVGIATNNPSAKLDVEGNAVLGSSGNTATGSYAVALNQNNTASSLDALATGENTTASGRQSFSGGFNTTASGAGSFAIGGNSVASGTNSLCAGGDGTTTGATATSIGTLNDATSDYSFAAGYNSTASGLVSFAMGSGATASGSKATAFGEGNNIAGELDFAVGAYNTSGSGRTYGNILAGYDNDITSYSTSDLSSLNIIAGTLNKIGTSGFNFSKGSINLVLGANNNVGFGSIGGVNVANGSNRNIVQGSFNTMLAYDSIALGQYNRTSYGGCSATIGFSLITPTNGSTSGNAFSANAYDTQFIVGRWNNFNINSYTQGHRFAVGNGTSDSSRFTAFNVLATSGNARVGIAKDVPAYPLDVTGTGRFTGGTTTSDERLKENIQDNTLGLSELVQLRTVTFDWKTDENLLGRTMEDHPQNKNCKGLIAQEVEAISSDLVETDDSEYGIKSINQGAITTMLIKAIQEQQDVIESLKERIQALENN